jgi:hypothetical protein
MATQQQDKSTETISSLVHTLLARWGYDSPKLGAVYAVDVYLDMDAKCATKHRMVCRCLCVHAKGATMYFSAPNSPSEKGRIPSDRWEGPDFCWFVVEVGDAPLVPTGVEYDIPDFSSLVLNDDLHANLDLYEVDYEDGRARELCIRDNHPVRREGELHVDLLRAWLSLLSTEERVEYGLYPKVRSIPIMSTLEATERLSKGKRDVYAFTTTSGPHCIFTARIKSGSSGVVIDTLKVYGQASTPEQLEKQGYHLFTCLRFPATIPAQESLFQLRRTALKLA